MMMPIPMNSASLSLTPNVSMAHLRTASGEWSTTDDPTAKYGEESGEIGTAASSPAARAAPTATTPASAGAGEDA